MLKNIPNIIPSELLKILMDMGHNDELVICDGNFPKFGQPAQAVSCVGVGTVELLDAVLSLMPLDKGGEKPFIHMQVTPGDNYVPEIWKEYDKVLQKHENREVPKEYLYKQDFYPRASRAYVAAVTGETAFYATIILRKGTL